ncbi:MAG: radical SAM protein [Methylobacter sp.]|nr:MAG: radical SAM protein [Methylobacter sp.]PPD05497.1 MAG: radical SAM protein [Methylobacter sp.]PPD21006.1 MAG: radical SAM protein [Methylobacter sp.]
MSLYQADGLEIQYLSSEEIELLSPEPLPDNSEGQLLNIQQKLKDTGQWHDGQIAGRRWAVCSVALEVTQRCNLDCTLCYLSEHSEAVKDVPLAELFRRIDMIFTHYGVNTDIQITGGDPTLRKREDLIKIVKYITALGMRCSLFTNGILATRDLLESLSNAGLSDVAFHVDITQLRKGYDSEEALNEIRQKYIDRARGLPLAVFFNTSVCAENFADIPGIVRFFSKHTDVVSLISFQLQADTGRGVLRERGQQIDQQTVIQQIESAIGTSLCFDTLVAGHQRCNSYAMAFAINGNYYDFYDDVKFSRTLLDATAQAVLPRKHRAEAKKYAVQAFLRAPSVWWPATRWLAKKFWAAKYDLWAARGRVQKMTFVLHNFMDASKLERDRIHSCVFMVATSEGPISMCLHNAKRDQYLFSGQTGAEQPKLDPVAVYPIKFLKGRSKQRALAENPAPAPAESEI